MDKLLAAHYQLDESEFEYTWNCIFPESAAQKAIRLKDNDERVCRLVETGVLSRESALNEVKLYGSVSKDATVGEDPNKQRETSKNVETK